MDEAQTKAIEFHMEELCEVIKSEIFMGFLCIEGLLKESECDLISRECTNESKVLKSLRLLIPKEGSWVATLRFLEKHKCLKIAENLRCSMWSHSVLQNRQSSDHQISLDWSQFIRDVTDFYLGDYRVVESFDVDGDSDLIESVWVDLQLEGSREPIGHYGEIFAQMRAKNCRLAIVRGQPGSGKTTLAKKIAYDWAKEEKKETFDFILAVPLRDVEPKSDLLEMAVGFHHGNNDYTELKRICADLRREKLKILIILDGLDEFQIQSESPLAEIFASALSNGINVVSTKPARLDFDLLVTSRPFACDLVHANIVAVQYEVVGFSDDQQLDFVLKKCRKHGGAERVVEYLQGCNYVKEISHNPYLLSLVCYLAENNKTIPSSLPSLYGTFVRQMLVRVAQKNARKNNFDLDPSKWQESPLLKDLGLLALLGIIRHKFEFDQDEMQMCHITKDHFSSGLLNYRSHPLSCALKADFPHRSIQEYIAALYFHQSWLSKHLQLSKSTGRGAVLPEAFVSTALSITRLLTAKEVFDTGSQFGRFLFALNSEQGSLVAMIDKLRLGFHDVNYQFSLDYITTVSRTMIDCKTFEQEHMGRRLLRTYSSYAAYLLRNWNEPAAHSYMSGIQRSFAKGLNLHVKYSLSGQPLHFVLYDEIVPRTAQLVVTRSPELLVGTLDRMHILMWKWAEPDRSLCLSRICYLPPIGCLFIKTRPIATSFHQVTARVTYANTTNTSSFEHNVFRFEYGENERTQLSQLVAHLSTVGLSVTDRRQSGMFVYLEVRIDRAVEQSALIFALIKQSLQATVDDNNWLICNVKMPVTRVTHF